jgi:hypothetical protein
LGRSGIGQLESIVAYLQRWCTSCKGKTIKIFVEECDRELAAEYASVVDDPNKEGRSYLVRTSTQGRERFRWKVLHLRQGNTGNRPGTNLRTDWKQGGVACSVSREMLSK